MEEHLNLSDTTITDETYTFSSRNILIEPGLILAFSPIKLIGVEFNAGYSFLLGKNAYYSPELDVYLYESASRQYKLKPEWNGLRFGLGIFLKM